MKSSICMFAIAALSATLPASAEEIRLTGASTVVNVVVNPHKAAVERATGYSLNILGNGTGKGLVALDAGQCDAAMVSEPLDIAMEAAKVAGKELNAADFQLHEIRKDGIVFVVNNSNPVKSLTLAQIKDIHTGKIVNWKEVGGRDEPILVFTDALTGGTRAMIHKVILKGEDFSTGARPLATVVLIRGSVAEFGNAIGGLGAGFVTSEVTVLKSEPVERPLGIATKGNPSAAVAKVIEAFRAEVAKQVRK